MRPDGGKLPLKTKLTFSSGSIQLAMVSAAGITTLLYYNQVLGVSPSLCGTAFLIASIVDAVSDPLVGALSDRFRSRWGRRHPFMLLSALPFAVSIYFLYQPMGGLSTTGLFFWLTTFSVLMRLSYTFFNVPFLALGAELTDDYHERTSLWSWFEMTSLAAMMILSWVVLLAVFPSTLCLHCIQYRRHPSPNPLIAPNRFKPAGHQGVHR
jgi:Na+/melibiose symporter-like transporter